MKNEKKLYKDLDRLTNMLVEDILSASDEEILAEAREEGDDPNKVAAECLKLFERARLNLAKTRLREAQSAVAADRKRASKATTFNISEARKKLEHFIASTPLSTMFPVAYYQGIEISSFNESDSYSGFTDLKQVAQFFNNFERKLGIRFGNGLKYIMRHQKVCCITICDTFEIPSPIHPSYLVSPADK